MAPNEATQGLRCADQPSVDLSHECSLPWQPCSVRHAGAQCWLLQGWGAPLELLAARPGVGRIREALHNMQRLCCTRDFSSASVLS